MTLKSIYISRGDSGWAVEIVRTEGETEVHFVATDAAALAVVREAMMGPARSCVDEDAMARAEDAFGRNRPYEPVPRFERAGPPRPSTRLHEVTDSDRDARLAAYTEERKGIACSTNR